MSLPRLTGKQIDWSLAPAPESKDHFDPANEQKG